MLYRLKQVINERNISGWFAVLSIITTVHSLLASVVLMGMSLFFWSRSGNNSDSYGHRDPV